MRIQLIMRNWTALGIAGMIFALTAFAEEEKKEKGKEYKYILFRDFSTAKVEINPKSVLLTEEELKSEKSFVPIKTAKTMESMNLKLAAMMAADEKILGNLETALKSFRSLFKVILSDFEAIKSRDSISEKEFDAFWECLYQMKDGAEVLNKAIQEASGLTGF